MPVAKKKVVLSAIGAERLFIVNVLILSILLGVNFVFATNMLKEQRGEVVRKKIDVKVLNEENAAVKSVGEYLKENQDVIAKTRLTMANVGFSSDYDARTNLTPGSAGLTFQEQFIYDVQNYAAQAGISVVGYSFPGTGSESAGAAAPSASSSPTSGGTGTGAATAPTGPTVPSGVQASNISISFGNEGKIPYANFIKFLSLLEQNTTRMYIASIDLTPDEGGSQIVQGSMEITIFSRKAS